MIEVLTVYLAAYMGIIQHMYIKRARDMMCSGIDREGYFSPLLINSYPPPAHMVARSGL